MRKRILRALMGVAALGACLGAWADDAVPNSLVVERQDGTTLTFRLSEKPTAVMGETELVLSTTTTTVTIPYADLKGFEMTEDKGSGIDGVENADNALTLNGDSMLLQGFGAGEAVTVYTLDGRVAASARTADDGTLTMPLTQLSGGVYVVNAGGRSFKIVRR